jgi:hypothetical protein
MKRIPALLLSRETLVSPVSALLNASCKQSEERTFHFADMDEKNDVGIAKLNESDLSLFGAANSFESKRPLKVKANGTVTTYESDAIVRVSSCGLTHSNYVPSH